MVWPEQYDKLKDVIKGVEKSIILFDAEIKYDERWAKSNQFTLGESSKFVVL